MSRIEPDRKSGADEKKSEVPLSWRVTMEFVRSELKRDRRHIALPDFAERISKFYEISDGYAESVLKGQSYPLSPNAFLKAVAKTFADDHLIASERASIEGNYLAELNSRMSSANAESSSTASISFSSLRNELNQLGLEPAEQFVKGGFFRDDPDRICIREAISLMRLRGQEGVNADSIIVTERKVCPSLPSCVSDELPRVIIDGNDGDKIALLSWSNSLLDAKFGQISIELAPSKYRVNRATVQSAPPIFELASERRALRCGLQTTSNENAAALPVEFHCDGIVLTGDQQMILARRKKTTNVYPGTWDVSVGEGMTKEEDIDELGNLSPLRTIYRALEQELGLTPDWISESPRHQPQIRFTDLIFVLAQYSTNLFAIIEFPNVSAREILQQARHAAKDGDERDRFEQFEFSPCTVAETLIAMQVNDVPLNPSSALNMLIGALHKFGSRVRVELSENRQKRSPA